jgi:hypothetical protein
MGQWEAKRNEEMKEEEQPTDGSKQPMGCMIK